MDFDKWRQLFELNPSKFIFIGGRSHRIYDMTDLTSDFTLSHPAIYKEDEERYYVIDFRPISYLKYFFYNNKIKDRISLISENLITETIVEDIQAKLDAIIDRSQKQIEESLKMRDEIVLRLHTDAERAEKSQKEISI